MSKPAIDVQMVIVRNRMAPVVHWGRFVHRTVVDHRAVELQRRVVGSCHIRHRRLVQRVERRLQPGIRFVDQVGDHRCVSSAATAGTWSSNASNAAVAAPLVHTLPAGSWNSPSVPVKGTAVDSDSATTGIRWLTSTLVTSVRLASAIAWPDQPRRLLRRPGHLPATSQSRVASLPSNTLLPVIDICAALPKGLNRCYRRMRRR